MKIQHTEGPWNVSKHATPDAFPQFGVYAEGNPCDHIIVKGVNAEADARLIAAAPELLETCQKLIGWLRAIRNEDEALVIEHGYEDGFNLFEAEGVISKATTI